MTAVWERSAAMVPDGVRGRHTERLHRPQLQNRGGHSVATQHSRQRTTPGHERPQRAGSAWVTCANEVDAKLGVKCFHH